MDIAQKLEFWAISTEMFGKQTNITFFCNMGGSFGDILHQHTW